jgi:hypothetical protein
LYSLSRRTSFFLRPAWLFLPVRLAYGVPALQCPA